MKFEETEVFNFKGALRGMRNPKNSWNKSDSYPCGYTCRACIHDDSRTCKNHGYCIGKADLKLAQQLIRGGSPHRKFLRQIFICVDITAPLYWWKEFDTYKVGTTSDSCSTMHKLADTPIDYECFEVAYDGEWDDIALNDAGLLEDNWDNMLIAMETLRQKYNDTGDKRYWKELIRLLPESWLQKRTVTMTYENVLNMIQYRCNHKLTEWSEDFFDWAKGLPYSKELLFLSLDGEKQDG